MRLLLARPSQSLAKFCWMEQSQRNGTFAILFLIKVLVQISNTLSLNKKGGKCNNSMSSCESDTCRSVS